MNKVVGVLIRIRKNENAEESRNYLIGMMEKLLRKETAQQKKEKLVEKYGLVLSDKTERVPVTCVI